MQEPEPIDWEYYRKGIGSRLVDVYKEAYDSMLSTFMKSTLSFNFFYRLDPTIFLLLTI